MKVRDIKTLLENVGHISKHYREIARLTGEEYNIFRTIGLQSAEVRLHSAILSDFLNPLGSHGQSDLFLRVFVNQQGITDFDTKTAIAEYEKYIGFINSDYTEGGRIDILIRDQNKKHIIIENKIYAGDQKNQLLRYYNFDRKAHLFYLTLYGYEPSDYSTNGEIPEKHCRVISYNHDIIGWLEECKKEAVSLPIIRETIVQYSNLLKQLTKQTTREKMKDEIKKLIFNNLDYIDSIEDCSSVIQITVIETKAEFEKLFKALFPSQTVFSDNDISIKVVWGEDEDGVYFGYQAFKGSENISNSEIGIKLGEIMKGIDSQIRSSPYYFAWFNPLPFERHHRFVDYNKREIFKMHSDPGYLNRFIENLIQQETRLRKEFLNRLNKKKKQMDNSKPYKQQDIT